MINQPDNVPVLYFYEMKGRIEIKPISANNAFKGRKFKTDKYIAYERELLLKLPYFNLEKRKLKLSVVFGFSSKLQDLDNSIKQTQDILVKKYGVDDRYIFELNLRKEIVPKGHEFIDFNFEYLK